jgi:hypothetical protein
VADKNVIFNIHALTDERVRGDLAVLTNPGVLLNLDKRANLGVISDFAAVQVHEIKDLDVFAKLHRWGDF